MAQYIIENMLIPTLFLSPAYLKQSRGRSKQTYYKKIPAITEENEFCNMILKQIQEVNFNYILKKKP